LFRKIVSSGTQFDDTIERHGQITIIRYFNAFLVMVIHATTALDILHGHSQKLITFTFI